MKTLLHLGATSRQYWVRDKSGWRPLPDGAAVDLEQPIWVVTDLTEETFAEIETPRLFGRDRADLLERKLTARFPSTHYRSVISVRREEKLLDRIAPVHAVIFGIDAAERLDSELAHIPHLAGISPMSLLLAKLGQHKQMPADLFVVMPEQNAVRIVFLKNRIPVLTRLAPASSQSMTQIEEILRTQRYLENLRLLERGGTPPAVLLLGNAQEFATPLAMAHLNLITPPANWRPALFDMALRMPFGQVAPVTRRTRFLAARLRTGALAASVAVVATSMLVAGMNLMTISDTVRDQEQTESTLKQINVQSAEVERRIAAFGIAPERMRRVIEFNDREIASAPSLASHLQLVAAALNDGRGTHTADPSTPSTAIQLGDLDWRLANAGETLCATTGTGTGTPTGAATGGTSVATPALSRNNPSGNAQSVTDHNAPRRVELNFSLTLPGIVDARERSQALRAISTRLAQIDGAVLMHDPVVDLAQGALHGSSAADVTKKYAWCMSLPGQTALAEPSGQEQGGRR